MIVYIIKSALFFSKILLLRTPQLSVLFVKKSKDECKLLRSFSDSACVRTKYTENVCNDWQDQSTILETDHDDCSQSH